MSSFQIEKQLSKSISDITTGNFLKSDLIEKSSVSSSGLITHSFGYEIKLPQVEDVLFVEVYYRIEKNKTIENNAVVSFKRESLFYPYIAYTRDSKGVLGLTFIDLFGDESGVDLKQVRESFEALLPYGELLNKVSEKYESEIIIANDALDFGRDYNMLAS